MPKVRRVVVTILWMSLLLAPASCSPGSPAPRPTPITPTPTPVMRATRTADATLNPSPTFTITPTPTPTPTLTPTPELLAMFETPLPRNLAAITYNNAAQVSGLALWYEALVTDIAWTPDERLLAVSTQDLVHFYDLPERRVVRSLYPELGDIVDIEFGPLGQWLIVGTRRGSEQDGYVSGLEMWAGPDWKPRGILYGTDRALADMAFSPDNEYFAAAYAHPRKGQNVTDLWLPNTWTISTTLQTELMQTIAFSGDGRFFAVSPDRYAVRIYDLVDRLWILEIMTSFTGSVNTMVFAPDGFTLATGHYDGVVRLWDIRTGLLLVAFETNEVIQSLAFNPDGTLVASGGSFQDQSVRIWAAGSGELLRTLEGHTKGVTQLSFSPGGEFLVSASYDGTMRLWGVRP